MDDSTYRFLSISGLFILVLCSLVWFAKQWMYFREHPLNATLHSGMTAFTIIAAAQPIRGFVMDDLDMNTERWSVKRIAIEPTGHDPFAYACLVLLTIVILFCIARLPQGR